MPSHPSVSLKHLFPHIFSFACQLRLIVVVSLKSPFSLSSPLKTQPH